MTRLWDTLPDGTILVAKTNMELARWILDDLARGYTIPSIMAARGWSAKTIRSLLRLAHRIGLDRSEGSSLASPSAVAATEGT